MDIKTVKDIGEFFLVNDLTSIPKIFLNKDYRKVKAWLSIKGNNLTNPESKVLKQAKRDKKVK